MAKAACGGNFCRQLSKLIWHRCRLWVVNLCYPAVVWQLHIDTLNKPTNIVKLICFMLEMIGTPNWLVCVALAGNSIQGNGIEISTERPQNYVLSIYVLGTYWRGKLTLVLPLDLALLRAAWAFFQRRNKLNADDIGSDSSMRHCYWIYDSGSCQVWR
jgi:hypothetical protein